MKKYTETRGWNPFDWNKELSKRDKDWYYLKRMSSRWVTCACGNTCAIIPRDDKGMPYDTVLSDLGHLFYEKVCDMNTRGAKATLKKIEARSSELIQEILKDDWIEGGEGTPFKPLTDYAE